MDSMFCQSRRHCDFLSRRFYAPGQPVSREHRRSGLALYPPAIIEGLLLGKPLFRSIRGAPSCPLCFPRPMPILRWRELCVLSTDQSQAPRAALDQAAPPRPKFVPCCQARGDRVPATTLLWPPRVRQESPPGRARPPVCVGVFILGSRSRLRASVKLITFDGR